MTDLVFTSVKSYFFSRKKYGPNMKNIKNRNVIAGLNF